MSATTAFAFQTKDVKFDKLNAFLISRAIERYNIHLLNIILTRLLITLLLS